MKEDKLLELKKQIDEAKNTAAELKGQQQALLAQLKNEWECDSIEKAEKKLLTMEFELDSINEKIEKGIEDLQSKYNV